MWQLANPVTLLFFAEHFALSMPNFALFKLLEKWQRMKNEQTWPKVKDFGMMRKVDKTTSGFLIKQLNLPLG